MRSRMDMVVKSYGSVVLAVVGAALVFGIAIGSTAAGESGCSGKGTQSGSLSCTGSCDDEEQACEPQDASDSGGPYQFCGCDPQAESSCCHVIKRNSTFEVKGDCPSCSEQGICCIVENGDKCEASCLPTQCPIEGNECPENGVW